MVNIYPLHHHLYMINISPLSPIDICKFNISPLHHAIYDHYISSLSLLCIWSIYLLPIIAIYDQHLYILSIIAPSRYIWSIYILSIIAIYMINMSPPHHRYIYILSIIAIKQLNSWSSTPDGWWTCPTHDEQMDSACSLHAGWSCKAQIQGNEHLPS
jgi:hypothetical protein